MFYTNTDLISPHEYVLALFYLLVIYFLAYFFRQRYYRNSPLKKYFIPGLTVKIIGAIGVTLIYNYYYKGGDTCVYFTNSKSIASIFFSNPIDFVRLLFSYGGNFSPDLLIYVKGLDYTFVESSYMVIKISAFLQLFTFQSFLITSVLFGIISFWAIWRTFKVFCSYYPELINKFAIAFLFIPSVFFWGSGILKDTVSLAGLAIFFYCIDGFFIKGKNKIRNGIGIAISGYIIAMVKVYIIMSFTLCILIFILLHYRKKIKSKSLRILITPIFVTIAITAGIFIVKIISESSSTGKYTFDMLLETSEITREYIHSLGGGSTYSLGKIENSIWGLIKIFPAGVNVTLFRPYLWEANNFIAIIASLESLALFAFTLITLVKTKFIYFFKILLSNNLVFFCVLFSIIFAFSVGVTSYNFGALVRYKIPCIPFYISAIMVIKYLYQKKSTTTQSKQIIIQ